ncbi:MAG: Ig-like domain-containing protein, partial [Gemmatimonadaceae bacterium]|nr:Ig-like domain-containing protein [Gemmatimonadaceae bacterium]
MATVDAATGIVTPTNRRGAVTLRALSLSGLTDTLRLTLLSPPASVAAISGGGQTGTAGRSLATPLVVEVTAADGLPAAGTTVAFAATGAGSISPSSAVTDANGRASASITLGAQLGEQGFTATVTGLVPVAVVQHAVAGAPASIVAASADTVRGVAGRALVAPLVVHVRDEFGLPVAAATVSWSVSGSGGTLAAATSITSAAGAASVGFTFGNTAGASIVTAAIGERSTTIVLFATHDSPGQLTIVSGDAQQAPASTALAPLVVRLADQHGNPVSGASVAWSRTAGSGSLSGTSSTTGSDGQASVIYMTGSQAGPDRVIASTAGFEAAFTAMTQAGAPSVLQPIAGNGQSVVAGTTIPVRMKARVTDADGNGVVSIVDVTVTAPGGATQTASGIATDTAGYVLVPLALLERPRVAGTYSAVVKLQASPTTQVAFTLTVTPAPPAAITILMAPASATSGALLSPQPSLQLVDSLGNASPTAAVTISANATGGGTLAGTTTSVTDTTGRAAFSDLLLRGSGTATIAFHATGLAGIARDVVIAEAPPPPQPVLTAERAGAGQVRISQFHGAVGGLGVIVRDSANMPVAGVAVHFTLAGDGSHGTFSGSSFELTGATDSTGTALFADWRPPSAPGTYVATAQARVNAIAIGAPITFTAVRSTWTYTLSASPASPIAGGTAEVAAALVDGAGVPVAAAGRTIAWTSNASLGAATSATDTSGVARVTV